MSLKKFKKSIPLKWDSKINFSDLLNVIVVLLAFFALWYQKKDVETKIDHLEKVIERLEEEELTRELHDLQNSTKDMEDFSYNLDFSTNQIKALSDAQSMDLTFTLEEINDIIKILLKEDLQKTEKEKLEILLERNNNKQIVQIISKSYGDSIDFFYEKFSPEKINFDDTDSLIKAQKKFNLEYEEYIDEMNKERELKASEYIKELHRLEEKYINLKRHSR